MKSFEKLLMIGSLLLAGYAALALTRGLVDGVLCYQSKCAHYGAPGEYFLGYVAAYAGFIVFGLASAWRSKKNLSSNSALHTDASRQ